MAAPEERGLAGRLVWRPCLQTEATAMLQAPALRHRLSRAPWRVSMRRRKVGLNPETLRAFLLHHAHIPEVLTKRGLKDLARQFVGFGQATAVDDMLQTDDHQITLLFQSRLSIGEKKPVILRFPFTWPQSLVSQGQCSGRVRMTLVYAPPLDPAFGAEFVRVNLEASLKQLQAEPDSKGRARYTNQIAARYCRTRRS